MKHEWLGAAFALLAPVSIFLLFSFYVSAGLKYYLHLPRPRLLAYTAVFVGMLFTLTASMLYPFGSVAGIDYDWHDLDCCKARPLAEVTRGYDANDRLCPTDDPDQ